MVTRFLSRIDDPILGATLNIPTDLLVLSSRINPNPDNEHLSQFFKVPLEQREIFPRSACETTPGRICDRWRLSLRIGSLSERHQGKLLLRRWPHAGRAATVLSKEKIEAEGTIAYVNEVRCSGCGACLTVCAYNAISLDEERQVAVINEAMCKGCGACAATCRGSAIKLHGFEDEQILSILNTVRV